MGSGGPTRRTSRGLPTRGRRSGVIAPSPVLRPLDFDPALAHRGEELAIGRRFLQEDLALAQAPDDERAISGNVQDALEGDLVRRSSTTPRSSVAKRDGPRPRVDRVEDVLRHAAAGAGLEEGQEVLDGAPAPTAASIDSFVRRKWTTSSVFTRWAKPSSVWTTSDTSPSGSTRISKSGIHQHRLRGRCRGPRTSAPRTRAPTGERRQASDALVATAAVEDAQHVQAPEPVRSSSSSRRSRGVSRAGEVGREEPVAVAVLDAALVERREIAMTARRWRARAANHQRSGSSRRHVGDELAELVLVQAAALRRRPARGESVELADLLFERQQQEALGLGRAARGSPPRRCAISAEHVGGAVDLGPDLLRSRRGSDSRKTKPSWILRRPAL